MNRKYKFLLTGLLFSFLFFPFFQTSHAGFFDWFNWFGWFKNSESQSAPSDNLSVKQYTLLISKTGSGSLTSDDGKINCGNEDSCGKIYTYAVGSKVILTALPNSGYVLDKWNGCDSSSGNKCEITINKSRTVTLKFVQKAKGFSNVPQKSSSSGKSSSGKTSASSSKTFSSKSSHISQPSSSKNNSLASKSSSSSIRFSSSNSNTANSNEIDKNTFVISDDGTLIRTGCIQTETGCKDDNDTVDKEKTIKKFFQEHPGFEKIYDFVMLVTTFKTGSNIGEFSSTKKVINGTGDSTHDVNITGLNHLIPRSSAAGSARVV